MSVRCLAVISMLVLPLVAQAPKPDGPDQQAAAQLDQAERLLGEGKPAEALAKVKQARETAGTKYPWLLVRAWMVEGYAQVKAQDWPAAATAFDTVAARYADWPQVPEALLQLGRVRQVQKRLGEARSAWAKVIEVAPHSLSRLEAERLVIGADLDAGDLAAAARRLDTYLSAVAWVDEAPGLLLELGQAWLNAGQAQKALATFERLRTQYPGTEAAFTARRPMVAALAQLKRTDDALKLLTQAQVEAPEMFVVTDVAHLRADLLADAQPAQASAALDELVKRYPGTFVAARALARQAVLLRQAGDAAGAIARLKALVEAFAAPYWRVQSLPLLADQLREQKQWDAAEDVLVELVKLTDGTAVAADALLRMAEVQRAAGRKKAARKSLEKVVQTYKGPPVVPLAEQQMRAWEEEDSRK